MSNVLKPTSEITLVDRGAPPWGSSQPRNFWVTLTGNDSNSGRDRDNAYRTLDKASQSANQAGDIVNIGAGTWVEVSPLEHTESLEMTLSIRYGGVEGDPIVWQAEPGQTGNVILDGEVLPTTADSGRGGITLTPTGFNPNYVTLRNLKIINSRILGIAIKGGQLIDDASTGIRIEGCHIFNTNQPVDSGSNISGLRMTGTKDLVLINTLIEQVWEEGAPSPDHTECIEWFSTTNALIQNCEFRDASSGILSKGHYPTVPGIEATITNCVFHENRYQIYMFNAGENSEAPLQHVITNNIFYDILDHGIRGTPINAIGPGVGLDISNCVFDLTGSGIYGLTNSSINKTNLNGNIFIHDTTDRVWDLSDQNSLSAGLMDSCDHNVYENGVAVNLDRQGTNNTFFSTLATLQAATNAGFVTLTFDFPDANGVEATLGQNFVDQSGRDYHLKAGSPALALLPGGNDAGAYPTGNETVGLTGGGAYE